MAEPNHAGSIIVSLASLPDFLRRPMLQKRMSEYFTLPGPERAEVVANALAAGPDIPFPNFARLFKTWLEVLAGFPEERREELFRAYVEEVAGSPEMLIRFNLDGILEVFLTLDDGQRGAIAGTVRDIVGSLDAGQRRVIACIVPDNAKEQLGI